MVSALAAAAQTPRIHFFGHLTAGLVAAGFTLIPQDLWVELSRKMRNDKLLDTHDKQMYHGFLVRTNHARSEQHEYWQTTIAPFAFARTTYFPQASPNEQTWVIPVDELICLAYGNMDACDFVSITRLLFVGTEEQLRAAVAALPDGETD
jgi:hypothetical protein